MSRPTETATPMDALLAILDLEKLEENLFRGLSPQVGWQRVFGGQVIGQALVAAQRTVDGGRYVHSLHAYFMRPGDPSVPIIYEVDRIRDGSSFATRRVVAIQHGKAIFAMSASFQYDEDGFEHQFDMPDVPMPETLRESRNSRRSFSSTHRRRSAAIGSGRGRSKSGPSRSNTISRARRHPRSRTYG